MTGADTSRAWRELGAAALAHNVSVLRGALPPGCELMAVVKADAYGHGMSAVVPQLLSLGVRSFAAATLDEGSQLRALGAEGTVLILGCTSPQRAGELACLGLTQTVADLAHAEALSAQGVPLRVHLKIDTGMHRLGIAWDAPGAASAVFHMENLTVDGIYSHLCCADSLAPGDVSFTREQIRRFYALTAALAAQGISLPKLHLQSSYGLLNYPELRCDYARVGLALYGAAEGTAARSLGLRPVLSFRARVASVRDVAKGESVGYDRAFTARRKSRIAVLPIGRRRLSPCALQYRARPYPRMSRAGRRTDMHGSARRGRNGRAGRRRRGHRRAYRRCFAAARRGSRRALRHDPQRTSEPPRREAAGGNKMIQKHPRPQSWVFFR